MDSAAPSSVWGTMDTATRGRLGGMRALNTVTASAMDDRHTMGTSTRLSTVDCTMSTSCVGHVEHSEVSGMQWAEGKGLVDGL